MDKRHIINELESIIERGLEDSVIPVKKGNSIRIGQTVIRESRNGFLIYDLKTNKQIARTFFKTSAIAIAKKYAEGKDVVKRALALDSILLKHYNDAIFYKNTIKKTSDCLIKESRQCRLQIAMDKTQKAKEELDKFIFGL